MGYQALHVQGKVPFETLSETLSDFISTRFKFLMMEEGHNQELVNAVLPWVGIDIFDAYLRLRALETQRSIEDFGRLMVGFKRVYNITKDYRRTGSNRQLALSNTRRKQDLFELFEARHDVLHGRRQGPSL